jgi:protein TonB
VERDQKPDPRSPVQPGASSAPYFVAALVAAVALWAIQQDWTQDWKPPVPKPSKAAPPGPPKGDLRTLFSGDDYPAEAQMKGEEGTVQARLTIDVDGLVSDCAIIRSSGHRSLDDATCRILQRRARFSPARDQYGRAVPDSVITPPVTWRLED